MVLGESRTVGFSFASNYLGVFLSRWTAIKLQESTVGKFKLYRLSSHDPISSWLRLPHPFSTLPGEAGWREQSSTLDAGGTLILFAASVTTLDSKTRIEVPKIRT